MREGMKVAASRGVTSVHDKDGWLGALGLWQRLHAEGALRLRVWQSLPHEHARRDRGAAGSGPGSATACCAPAT